MIITIRNNKICICETDVLVAQSVKVYTAEFTFDTDWNGYAITAVFENNDLRYEQPLLNGTSCVIPWEVLEKPGFLYISAYGVKDDQRRVSTVSEGIRIRQGAEPGENPKEPTPDQYSQIMDGFRQAVGAAEDIEQNVRAAESAAAAAQGSSTEAANAAQAAAEESEAAAASQRAAEEAAARAEEASGNPPYIGEDGYWYTYDMTEGAFTRTGQEAQGIQGEQGPKGDTGAAGPQGLQGDTGPQGSAGEVGPQGPQGEKGTDGTNGATFTPSMDAAGNLSWSNDKGLSNPATVNIRGPQGVAGRDGNDGQPGADGAPGQDGAPGYTPVKGVDYWTGADKAEMEADLQAWTGQQGYQTAAPNAGSHNAIYRGKNLGGSVTDAQYAAIAAGTFEDLYIGDYWTIGGINYRIAAFDYYYLTGDTACSVHHLVIVPDSSLYNAQMNDTNTTEGGYVGSKMYTEGLNQAKTTIKAAFGSHVLKHRVYLTNAVTGGRPSAGAWYDSEVELMNEQMVYGGPIFMPMANGQSIFANYRVEKSQLPLFTYRADLIPVRQSYWLRDVTSASSFALVSDLGLANSNYASNSVGVRPAFCIC